MAFVLDMTGSMAYASTFNYNGNSLNPDDLVPTFGHYGSVQGNLIATVNQANGDGEAYLAEQLHASPRRAARRSSATSTSTRPTSRTPRPRPSR